LKGGTKYIFNNSVYRKGYFVTYEGSIFSLVLFEQNLIKFS